MSCIPHFKEFPPHLIEWVEFGTTSQMPPTKPQGPVLPPTLEAIVKAPAATPTTSVVSAPPPATAKPVTLQAPTGRSLLLALLPKYFWRSFNLTLVLLPYFS